MHDHFFRSTLLNWAAQNHRPLPWKGERDPYRIWLSEIILQQTRVEQGLPYYEKFITQYPTVIDLADAPEDEMMKLWEGLGYYSRARNLQAAAKYIAYDLNGIFPETYEGIRALKGVGDYTAAAVASFAYGLPYAVLDGNVYRVLARYFGIDTPTDTPEAKRTFTQLAQQLLDPAQPGVFNQAIMDFGATHCTPKQPKCANCPLQPKCVAFKTGRVAELPLKSKKLLKKNRVFIYAVVKHGEDTFVQKRLKKDIWQNLYEFPLMETEQLPADNRELEQLVRTYFFPADISPGPVLVHISAPYRQILTHQVVTAIFCEFILFPKKSNNLFEKMPFKGWQRVQKADLKKNIAFPRVISLYLQENAPTLSLI